MKKKKIAWLALMPVLLAGCANQSYREPGEVPPWWESEEHRENDVSRNKPWWGTGGEPPKPKKEVSPGYRYSMVKDKLPENVKDVSNVKDAVPRNVPYSKAGNKPVYEVWGKKYRVLASHIGFTEEGGASWYGEKFHGHKTSNGEIYNMYAMSAAHKNLPIPSYARVTNLENGKKVVVRVNDRGPFHSDRVIDLSYAAAFKLDMLKKGIAQVRVEGIQVYPSGSWTIADKKDEPIVSSSALPGTVTSSPELSASPGGLRLQVGSFNRKQGAYKLMNMVRSLGIRDAGVVYRDGLHKVVIGPFRSEDKGQSVIDDLQREGLSYFWLR